jgi:hypothetical protein
MAQRILWVVQYKYLAKLFSEAIAAQTTGIAIRTDNNLLQAIEQAHRSNLKVLRLTLPSALHDFALHESESAATLFAAACRIRFLALPF